MGSYTVIGKAEDYVKSSEKPVIKFLGAAKDYIKDEVTSTVEGVKGLYEGARTIGGVASSIPVKTMITDILPGFNSDLTEDYFSDEAVSLLTRMAQDLNLEPGESHTATYNDYNKFGARMSALLYGGVNEDFDGVKEKLLNLTPADEIKMTLGEITITKDEEGNLTVTDQYDFNSWVYFGEGAGPDGKYNNYTTEEYENLDISFMEALSDTITNAPSDYQMVRNLAFLFGNRDYVDDTKDKGRKVVINLSKGEVD